MNRKPSETLPSGTSGHQLESLYGDDAFETATFRNFTRIRTKYRASHCREVNLRDRIGLVCTLGAVGADSRSALNDGCRTLPSSVIARHPDRLAFISPAATFFIEIAHVERRVRTWWCLSTSTDVRFFRPVAASAHALWVLGVPIGSDQFPAPPSTEDAGD